MATKRRTGRPSDLEDARERLLWLEEAKRVAEQALSAAAARRRRRPRAETSRRGPTGAA